MRIEQRQERRETIGRRASVVFNGRQSVFECAIRNWSGTGAMLRLSDWTCLPSIFEIDLAGEPRRVRQCWRRGDDVGVTFLSETDCVPAAPISLDAARAARAARLAAAN